MKMPSAIISSLITGLLILTACRHTEDYATKDTKEGVRSWRPLLICADNTFRLEVILRNKDDQPLAYRAMVSDAEVIERFSNIMAVDRELIQAPLHRWQINDLNQLTQGKWAIKPDASKDGLLDHLVYVVERSNNASTRLSVYTSMKSSTNTYGDSDLLATHEFKNCTQIELSKGTKPANFLGPGGSKTELAH